MALNTVGHRNHPRTREGIKLLLDRQFADRGCNYGNTTVMGRQLLPHVQSIGIAMYDLVNEQTSQQIDMSSNYLRNRLRQDTPLASYCLPASGLQHIANGIGTTRTYSRIRQQKISSYKLALLYLVNLGAENPLLTSQYVLS